MGNAGGAGDSCCSHSSLFLHCMHVARECLPGPMVLARVGFTDQPTWKSKITRLGVQASAVYQRSAACSTK